MFCQKCGASITGQEAFCPNCGAVVLNKQQEQPAQNAQMSYAQGNQQYQQPNQQYQQQYQQPNQQAQNVGYMPNYGMPQQGVNPNTWAEIKRNNCIYNENGVPMGIGWFKFIVYVQLFLSALMSLYNAITFLTGSLYGGELAKALVYSFYSGLQAVDVIAGIVCLGIAALTIVTRFQLTGLKKSGPAMYFAVYIANIVVSLLYIIIVCGCIVKDFSMLSASIFSSIISSVVFLVINIIYFGKRKLVFKN